MAAPATTAANYPGLAAPESAPAPVQWVSAGKKGGGGGGKQKAAPEAPLRKGGGGGRARSRCRFVPPLVHFAPDSLPYAVPLFLKR